MTDLRKAAEMALESLEQTPTVNKLFDSESYEKQKDAIDALRQALAQPEQEPVAWLCESNDYGVWKSSVVLNKIDSLAFRNFVPLYTAPPKREWVGLSSLDKTFLRTAYAQLRPLYHDKEKDVSVAAEVVTDWDAFFAAIEAKLKEKNT